MRLLVFSAIVSLSFGAAAKPGRLERDAEVHHQKGVVLLEQGQYEDAIGEFNQAQELDPQPKNTLHIAECQEAMGNLLSAISSYKHYFAESNDPSEPLKNHVAGLDAKFHDDKGKKLREEHEYGGALREFQEAQKARPDAKRLYDLALCLEEMGENAKAVEHYRRYLKEIPDANDAGEVEGRIKILSGEHMAPPPAPPPPPPPPVHPPWWKSAGGWGLTVAAVALAGGSAGLFGATLGAGSTAGAARSEDDFLAAQSSGSLFNALGIACAVAAGVALVAAIVLFAAHQRSVEARP